MSAAPAVPEFHTGVFEDWAIVPFAEAPCFAFSAPDSM